MRWLALALLFANLAVCAYLLSVGRQPGTPADARPLELNAEQVRVIRSRVAAPEGAARAKAKPGACLEWGSFAAAELERAREELAKLQVAKLGVRELDPVPAWWVHVTPLRNRDEAERRVRELEELGIKDARVVTEERWRNAISLGVFKTQEEALAHQLRMRESKVRSVSIAQRNDLLRLSVIVIAEPTPALAARLVALKAEFAGSDVKAVACAARGD